jgi:hypothetical protein
VTSEAAGVPPAPKFTIALRGYERRQVDRHVERLLQARRDGLPLPGDAARPDFMIVLRGYERAEVDEYVRRLASVP